MPHQNQQLEMDPTGERPSKRQRTLAQDEPIHAYSAKLCRLFKDDETNLCATCGLSVVVRDDWPVTLDEQHSLRHFARLFCVTAGKQGERVSLTPLSQKCTMIACDHCAEIVETKCADDFEVLSESHKIVMPLELVCRAKSAKDTCSAFNKSAQYELNESGESTCVLTCKACALQFLAKEADSPSTVACPGCSSLNEDAWATSLF